MINRFRKFLVIALVVGAFSGIGSPNAHASLIAMLGDGNNANDPDGLAYLNNVLGVTGLTLLAKEDIGGGFTGAVNQADWTLADTGRTGTWTIDDPTWKPTYWFNKFDGLLAIYSYMGPSSSPWSDSYNLNVIWTNATNTLNVPIVDQSGNTLFPAPAQYPNFPPPNPNADTSHVSVLGERGGGPPGQIPEPATLLLCALGLLALGGTGIRRRQRAAV